MDEQIEALLPFYVLAALTPEEQAQVEAYVRSHPEVEAELAEMKTAAAALPYAAAPMTPSPAVKERLMAQVQAAPRQAAQTPRPASAGTSTPAGLPAPAARPPQTAWWQRWQAWWAGLWAMPAFSAAALLLIITLGFWGFAQNRQLQTIRAQNAALNAENEALRQAVLGEENLIAVLSSDSHQAITIRGTEVQPQARGHLFQDAASQAAVLVVSDLPLLPADRTYQFWLIQAGVAVDAGIFQVNQDGRGLLTLPPSLAVSPFDAIGVSIEPLGGSAQPTGDIVMLGEA